MSFAQASQLSSELAVDDKQAVEMLHEIIYQGIRMVRTLSRLAPQWLLGVPRVVRFLLGMWTSTEWRNRVHDDSPHNARNAHEFSLLLKILIQYCRTTLITNGSSAMVATAFLTSPSAGQYIQPLFDLLFAFSRPVGSSGVCIDAFNESLLAIQALMLNIFVATGIPNLTKSIGIYFEPALQPCVATCLLNL